MAAAATAMTIGVTAEAQSYPPPPAARPTPPLRLEGWASFDVFAKRFFTLPTATLIAENGTRGAARDAAVGEGITLAGVGASLGVTFENRWIVPMLHMELSSAVGRSPRVVTAVDGTIAELRPWTAKNVAIHMFGFGVRGIHRRWMAEASVIPGFAITWMQASLARGDETTAATGMLITASIRGELAGCRRLDPGHRLCLVVAPNIYEHGLFNGGAIGLRWEVGP